MNTCDRHFNQADCADIERNRHAPPVVDPFGLWDVALILAIAALTVAACFSFKSSSSNKVAVVRHSTEARR